MIRLRIWRCTWRWLPHFYRTTLGGVLYVYKGFGIQWLGRDLTIHYRKVPRCVAKP